MTELEKQLLKAHEEQKLKDAGFVLNPEESKKKQQQLAMQQEELLKQFRNEKSQDPILAKKASSHFIPFGRYILAKVITPPKTETLILVGQQNFSSKNDNSDLAEIMKVGTGEYDKNGNLIKPRVKVGDKVIIKKFMVLDYGIGDINLIVIDEDAIIGFYED